MIATVARRLRELCEIAVIPLETVVTFPHSIYFRSLLLGALTLSAHSACVGIGIAQVQSPHMARYPLHDALPATVPMTPPANKLRSELPLQTNNLSVNPIRVAALPPFDAATEQATGPAVVGLKPAVNALRNSAGNPFANAFGAAYAGLTGDQQPSSRLAALPGTPPKNLKSSPNSLGPQQGFAPLTPEQLGDATVEPSLVDGPPATEMLSAAPSIPNFIDAETVDSPLLSDPLAASTEVNEVAVGQQLQIFQQDAATDSLNWWKSAVAAPLQDDMGQQGVDTNSLVYAVLQNSPRIRALSQTPLIREQQIVEADAVFDPVSFLRSQFQDRVDPVGDNLSITSDGSLFLEDHIWTAEGGIRKRTRTGATYELSETLGFKNSNSSFFTPQDQGTATLSLNVSQPLLRGRGRYFNQSQILIAQSSEGVAWNTFLTELQDEVQRTVEAYWQLYFERSVFLQKQRNVERGAAILEMLVGRQDLDSLPSQIARARSAVQSRKTDLANAVRNIRNSETELRRLTADRNWKANQSIELIPLELPVAEPLDLELEQIVFTALENRPEIKETMTRAKIAGIQRDISANELLPELSLLLGTYVSALQGESQLGQAIQDQFGEVKPGYNVGFEFELPIYNRAAKSRLQQRRLQLEKIRAEVDESMQNVVAESQISLRRVTSARETMIAASQAIEAARADLQQNFRRWESFALVEGDLADGRTPTTILDQLLDSQERLTAAELVFAQAELELKVAEVSLQRTMGTLLVQKNVSLFRSDNDGLPAVEFDGAPSSDAATGN